MILRGIGGLLLAFVAVPGWAQLRPKAHYSVAQEHVARAVVSALSGLGINVDEPQVALLTEVVATEPLPALEVRSTMVSSGKNSSGTSGQTAVKLACHLPGTCLPFYAVVNWPVGVKMPDAVPLHPSVPAVVLKGKRQILLRAGVHATLMLDDGQVHLRVPVISMESGSEGQNIRVISLDHKRTYTGQAVGPALLKGVF